MILPLSLLKCAQNSAVLLELKSGDTYNGHMVSIDNFMNIHLRDAICTSKQYKKQLNRGAGTGGGAPVKRKAEDGSDIPNKASRGQGGNRGRGRGRGR
ncbi:hypothetical protein FO519_007107 [Halicephalobus sp. NKZ332]|nr:hypothetical protein FO519_007107 [Halicephalobus sp. NKZ332]